MYNRKMFERARSIGMIARWKPVHLGQAVVLRALCSMGDHTRIGIGSSNRYNARNPFTLAETESMLRLTLAGRDNFSIIPVPDLDDGPRWRLMVLGLFGELDLFVTDNPYVANLLRNDYRVIRPVELIPSEEQVRVDGSMVRALMAQGEGWQAWVEEGCANFIQQNKLDERFRREFGLETLAMQIIIQ
jgi:nicotinamide-nucleotide adenylyltransferase